MSCARGCCETQAEHYRSLHVGDPNRKHLKKVTEHRDSDAAGGGAAEVTEHWHDRQDVLIKPPPVKAALQMQIREEH